jgi:hypothetical protein
MILDVYLKKHHYPLWLVPPQYKEVGQYLLAKCRRLGSKTALGHLDGHNNLESLVFSI